MRVGIGYDVHKLVEGRHLVIGGVQIPFDKGLLGHSDADVLVHAIMDALLGAAGKGDIGRHFPDSDKTFEGISSIFLLSRVYEVITREGYKISNIDAVVIAQAPKMAIYFDGMIQNISLTLNLNSEQINIKATTTEGLGFEGKGMGIAAYAVVLLD